MKNVSEKTLMQNVKTALEKKMQLSLFSIIAYIFLAVVLSASVYYYIGLNDGYSKKTIEINKEKQAIAEQDLMNAPYAEVKDTFYKFLMVKTMSNIDVISIALLFVLILWAIF